MGLKTEVKKHMVVGSTVSIHQGNLEYKGVVEVNTLINQDHGAVESDSCCVIRSDEERQRYIIPLGHKVNFVLVVPFPDEEGGAGEVITEAT